MILKVSSDLKKKMKLRKSFWIIMGYWGGLKGLRKGKKERREIKGMIDMEVWSNIKYGEIPRNQKFISYLKTF